MDIDPSLNPHSDLPICIWILIERGSRQGIWWYATAFHPVDGFREVLGTAVRSR